MSTVFRTLIACLLGSLILAGCTAPDERLQALGRQIKVLEGRMQLGEVREIPLPSLKPGEWLVAVNGQYAGRVCEPSPLTKQLATEINDKFSISEAPVSAYLLLASGDRIQSESIDIVIWQPKKNQALCALIADSSHKALVAECLPPPASNSSGHLCDITLRAVK